MASDGDITLVPTGPLTNIAMAMRMEPKITSKIREIVLMGGCYQLGRCSAIRPSWTGCVPSTRKQPICLQT